MLLTCSITVISLPINCNVARKIVIDPSRCGLWCPLIPVFTLVSQSIDIAVPALCLIVPWVQVNLVCLGEVDVRSGVLVVSCRHIFNIRIIIDLRFRVILQLVEINRGCTQSIYAFDSHKTSIIEL